LSTSITQEAQEVHTITEWCTGDPTIPAGADAPLAFVPPNNGWPKIGISAGVGLLVFGFAEPTGVKRLRTSSTGRNGKLTAPY